jgi:hypothetical protein
VAAGTAALWVIKVATAFLAESWTCALTVLDVPANTIPAAAIYRLRARSRRAVLPTGPAAPGLQRNWGIINESKNDKLSI